MPLTVFLPTSRQTQTMQTNKTKERKIFPKKEKHPKHSEQHSNRMGEGICNAYNWQRIGTKMDKGLLEISKKKYK